MSFLHDQCTIFPSSRWIAVAFSFRWLHPSPRRMALSVYRYDILHRHCSQSLLVTWAQHLQNWAVDTQDIPFDSCFVMFCSFLRCLAHQIWWDVHVLARHSRLGYSRCQRSWGSKVLRTRPRAHENIRRGADVMLHADTNLALEIGLLTRKQGQAVRFGECTFAWICSFDMVWNMIWPYLALDSRWWRR